MRDTAQPMHAFDLDKIEGGLVLRAAKEGERMRTLDGGERALSEGAIIIEDSKKLIDLAGLMGGENTEIGKGTKNVLLHVPIYDPVAIRRASQALGLRTEASNRFEKRLDPNGHIIAFRRAVKLMADIAGGQLASEPKSITLERERTVRLPLELVKSVLGVEIKIKEIVNILSSLGFQVVVDPFEDSILEVRVPSFRGDVELPIDLTEEIGR